MNGVISFDGSEEARAVLGTLLTRFSEVLAFNANTEKWEYPAEMPYSPPPDGNDGLPFLHISAGKQETAQVELPTTIGGFAVVAHICTSADTTSIEKSREEFVWGIRDRLPERMSLVVFGLGGSSLSYSHRIKFEAISALPFSLSPDDHLAMRSHIKAKMDRIPSPRYFWVGIPPKLGRAIWVIDNEEETDPRIVSLRISESFDAGDPRRFDIHEVPLEWGILAEDRSLAHIPPPPLSKTF